MDEQPEMSESQLRQTQLEAILSSAVDAIITIDESGCVQSMNPATERIFGFAPHELLGRNVRLLMPAEYSLQHDAYLENYRRTGQRKIIGIGREVVGQRKDGSTFPVHLAVSEYTVGQRRFFTGIVRDISELTQAELQLTQLNESLEKTIREKTHELRKTQADLLRIERLATLGQVSGGIAHEIRNPLSAIKTSAYFLLNAQNPSPAKIREHLERIDRQVTLIDNVITALTDVARTPQPDLRPQLLSQHIQDVLQLIAIPSSIELILDLPSRLPEVLADANQLPIVLKNLICNARDAMPDGGTLTIGATVDNQGSVTVFVRDTGVGIAPEDILRITEPLYSTKARGMGLGLAISQAIVQKNRGRLRVESQVGQGSTFSVDLTAADCEH